MSTSHSPGSYPLKVHLSVEAMASGLPSAIALLESKYPTEDPEMGLLHLVNEVMCRAKRTAAAKVQVLTHPEYAAPNDSPSDLNTPEPAAQPQAVPASQTQPSSNSVGSLQEYCQRSHLALPEYQFEPSAEGFFVR